MTTRWQIWGLAMALIAILGSAQPAKAQLGRQVFLLADGRSIVGQLVQDDGREVQVSLDTGDHGAAIMTLHYDQLDPRTIYRLKLARTPERDGEAQLALADYAMEHGLYDVSRSHLQIARDDDPALAGRVDAAGRRLRALASGDLLAKARREAEVDRVREAEQTLSMLNTEFPDAPATAQGAALLRELKPKLEAPREKAMEEQLAAEEEQGRHLAKEAEASLAYGRRQTRLALENIIHQGTALDLFHDAIRSDERARRILKKLPDTSGQDAQLTRLSRELDRDAVDQIDQAYVDMGSLYLVRGSDLDALASANQALALDPHDQEAKALRARTEIAANRWGWRAGWRRWFR